MQQIFLEIPCLTEQSKALSADYLYKKWFKDADKRYTAKYLQKFIEYNKSYFDFLGVTPMIEGSDKNLRLRFKSREFIGAIPLRNPGNGLQIGDFIVSPRYGTEGKFSDYVKILNLLNQSIQAEFKPSPPLRSGRNFQPPLYYEAVIFLKKLHKLTRTHWVKFDQEERILNAPLGQVNWKKYVEQAYKVENRTKFPVRKNILSEQHAEYGQLKYVYELAKNEILGPSTPQEIKYPLLPLIRFLDKKLQFLRSIPTTALKIKHSDPPIVKEVKKQANKILQKDLNVGIAWRVDFNKVFEKYVQYLFTEISKELGGTFYPNHKIRQMTTPRYPWELSGLEPDGIYIKGNRLNIFIDAKYKSHLLNKHSDSKELQKDFRHDLHQIMAYTSFSKKADKYGILCYPSARPEIKKSVFYNSLSTTRNTIFVLGIPLNVRKIPHIKSFLRQLMTDLEKDMAMA